MTSNFGLWADFFQHTFATYQNGCFLLVHEFFDEFPWMLWLVYNHWYCVAYACGDVEEEIFLYCGYGPCISRVMSLCVWFIVFHRIEILYYKPVMMIRYNCSVLESWTTCSLFTFGADIWFGGTRKRQDKRHQDAMQHVQKVYCDGYFVIFEGFIVFVTMEFSYVFRGSLPCFYCCVSKQNSYAHHFTMQLACLVTWRCAACCVSLHK